MRFQMVNVVCHWPPASVSADRVKKSEQFDMCEGPLFETVLAASLAASASGGPQQAAPSPLNPQTSSERKEERGKLGDTRPTGTGDSLSKAIRASDLPSCVEAVRLAEGHAANVREASTARRELADPGHDSRLEAASAARLEKARLAANPDRHSRQAAAQREQMFKEIRDEVSNPGPTADRICRYCREKKIGGKYADSGCCNCCWNTVLKSRANKPRIA